MVDFSIVLLKIILVPYVHKCYIQNHIQLSLFSKVQFEINSVIKISVYLFIITRFTYVTKNKRLLFLLNYQPMFSLSVYTPGVPVKLP